MQYVMMTCNPATMFKEAPDFIEKVQQRAKRGIKKRGIKMYAICPATKEVLQMHWTDPRNLDSWLRQDLGGKIGSYGEQKTKKKAYRPV